MYSSEQEANSRFIKFIAAFNVLEAPYVLKKEEDMADAVICNSCGKKAVIKRMNMSRAADEEIGSISKCGNCGFVQ